MNAILDSGAELNSAAWVYEDLARRQQVVVYAGAWAWRLAGRREDEEGGVPVEIGARLKQSTIFCVAGSPVILRARTLGDFAPEELLTLSCSVDLGDGVWQLLAERDQPTAGAWEFWEIGTFVPTQDSFSLRFEVYIPEGPEGPIYSFWYLDELVAEVGAEATVAVSKWAAVMALHDALCAINGVGYYNDFGGRVYTKDVTPQDGIAITLPYATLPFTGEAEVFDHHGPDLLIARWRQGITVYVAENAASELDTSTVEALSNVRDDLCRALLLVGWTLNGTVRDMTIVDAPAWASVEDAPYGEIRMMLELQQAFGADDLGPSAGA